VYSADRGVCNETVTTPVHLCCCSGRNGAVDDEEFGPESFLIIDYDIDEFFLVVAWDTNVDRVYSCG
jgi:hypothetical protein